MSQVKSSPSGYQDFTLRNKDSFLVLILWNLFPKLPMDTADRHFRSRHAGRSTVTPSDVLMLCRRNEGLEQTLKTYQEHLESTRDDAS